MDQRDVRLENLAIAKLIGKVLERSFSLRDGQESRRVSVQPVNDARGHRCRYQEVVENDMRGR